MYYFRFSRYGKLYDRPETAVLRATAICAVLAACLALCLSLGETALENRLHRALFSMNSVQHFRHSI
jgi:hypothetical protein